MRILNICYDVPDSVLSNYGSISHRFGAMDAQSFCCRLTVYRLAQQDQADAAAAASSYKKRVNVEML